MTTTTTNEDEYERDCRDCGGLWTYTAAERTFMEQRGFVAPVRCPECRERRRREQRQSGGTKAV